MKQRTSYSKMLKTALKISIIKNSYSYLNSTLGFGFPKQTWKTKNRFYPTMHHSVMSYEDLKRWFNLPMFQFPKLHFDRLNDIW